MQIKNSFTKKGAKAVTASALGLALLAGGGTYALWSANAPVNSEATITTGDLQVTAGAPISWQDVTDAANPRTIENLSDFLMAPGDKLRLTQSLNTVVIGDNISGILELLVPNSTQDSAILSQAKFTLALYDDEGKELGKITPSVNTPESLKVLVEKLPTTGVLGDNYLVELIVELPGTSDNATKVSTAALQNMSFVLRQGEKLNVLKYPTATAQSAFQWSVSGDNAVITRYVGTDKEVVIPETIEVNGVKKTVTGIADANAFKNTYLKSITLPKGMKSIAANAFDGMTTLTSVTISEGTTSIGNSAFADTSIKVVTLPASVTSIGSLAFHTNRLGSVYFEGNAPTTFGYQPFSSNFENVTVYYHAEAIGFTSPKWKFYKTATY